jgi:hypothetical protein
VGVGPRHKQKPVICLELEPTGKHKNKKKIIEELQTLAQESVLTKDMDTFLFHKSFPVDIRHNSKIFREILTTWAEKKLN